MSIISHKRSLQDSSLQDTFDEYVLCLNGLFRQVKNGCLKEMIIGKGNPDSKTNCIIDGNGPQAYILAFQLIYPNCYIFKQTDYLYGVTQNMNSFINRLRKGNSNCYELIKEDTSAYLCLYVDTYFEKEEELLNFIEHFEENLHKKLNTLFQDFTVEYDPSFTFILNASGKGKNSEKPSWKGSFHVVNNQVCFNSQKNIKPFLKKICQEWDECENPIDLRPYNNNQS